MGLSREIKMPEPHPYKAAAAGAAKRTCSLLRLLPAIAILACLTQAAAQDTTGFISVSDTIATNPRINWQENWFTGEWYNFSFVDNFSYTYRYYVNPRPSPRVPEVSIWIMDLEP